MNAKVSLRKKKNRVFFCTRSLLICAMSFNFFYSQRSIYKKKPKTKQRSHHTAYLQTDLVFLNGSN